jgi:hypothetical protein
MVYSPPAYPTIPVAPATGNARATRAGRLAGSLVGSAVRLGQEFRHDGAAPTLRRLVQRYPAILIGAGIAGFLSGRMIKGR